MCANSWVPTISSLCPKRLMRMVEEIEKEGLKQRLTWWEENQRGEEGGWSEIEGTGNMEEGGCSVVMERKQEE